MTHPQRLVHNITKQIVRLFLCFICCLFVHTCHGDLNLMLWFYFKDSNKCFCIGVACVFVNYIAQLRIQESTVFIRI